MPTQHNCQYLKKRNSTRSLNALLSLQLPGMQAKIPVASDLVLSRTLQQEKNIFSNVSIAQEAGKERKESVLRSYTKALDSGDYETANNIDVRHLGKEDLASARRKVFARKIVETVKTIEMRHAIARIEKLRVELQIDDATLRGEVRTYLLAREQHSIEERRTHGAHGYTGLSERTRSELASFGEYFGATPTPKEVRAARVEGFFQRVNSAPSRMTDKKRVDELLFAYGLDAGIVRSQRFKSTALQLFGEELLSANVCQRFFPDTIGSAVRMLRGAYFPSDALSGRNFRSFVDAWFKRESAACAAIANGTFVPDNPPATRAKESDPLPDYRTTLERLFYAGKHIGISDEASRDRQLVETTERYLNDYFASAARGWFPCHFTLPELERLGFQGEALTTKAQAAYLQTLRNVGNLHALKQLREIFLLSREFLWEPESVEASLVYANALVKKNDWRTLISFLDLEPFPKEFQASDVFLRFREQTLLWAIDPKDPGAKTMRTLVEKLGLPGDNEPAAREFLTETVDQLVGSHIGGLKELFRSGNFYYVEYCGENFDPNRSSAHIKALQLFYESAEIAKVTGNTGRLQQIVQKVGESVFRDTSDLPQLLSLSTKTKVIGEKLRIAPETFRAIALAHLTRNIGARCDHQYGITPSDRIGSSAENLQWFQKIFGFTKEETQTLAHRAFTHFSTVADDHPRLHELGLIEIAKHFHLPAHLTNEGALTLFERHLAEGRPDDALRVKQHFGLSVETPAIEKKAEERFLAALRAGETARVLRAASNGVSEKVLAEPAVKKDLRILLQKTLSSPHHGADTEGIALLGLLPEMTTNELALIHPERQQIVSLTKCYPKIAQKIFATPANIIANVHMAAKMLVTLTRHPFTATAVLENPRYGLKLAEKIAHLDKLSRENIATIYAAKGVLRENGVHTDDAHAFRTAIQEKLLPYRRNSEIADALRRKSVRVESWLDHRATTNFILGGHKGEKLSTFVGAPIERIGASIAAFETASLTALLPFKKELTATGVPSARFEKMRSELAALEVKLSSESGEENKRTAGMRKQVEKLRIAVAKEKPMPLWEKLTSELARTKLVYQRVAEAHATLASAEEGGAKIGSARVELNREIATLFERMNTVHTSLESLIAPALGKERSSAIAQEVRTNTAEHFDHLNADRGTLSSALDSKEGGTLSGRPMEVRVWSRDPDVDLYMGNYTNCCIRIDSDHMGEESTIADYLTDVGMQVVAVYDKTTDAPVAAAWCWIGHDDDDRLAFVVDNIEADTNYTKDHRPELTQALGEFIRDYAAKAGVPHIVQGTANNDITIARMDSAYFKVGGYNRASGYFLEGEDQGQYHEDDHENEYNDDEFVEADEQET